MFNFIDMTYINDPGHQSQRTKSALQIGGQAKRVVLLSGTPALSRPSELYSQLQILESKNKIFNG